MKKRILQFPKAQATRFEHFEHHWKQLMLTLIDNK